MTIAPRVKIVEAVDFLEVRERTDLQDLLRANRINGDVDAYRLECGHWVFGSAFRMLTPVGGTQRCWPCAKEEAS